MFLKWWTALVLSAFVFIVGQYLFDWIGYIIIYDQTYLSFIILAIYIGATMKIGHFGYKLHNDNMMYHSKPDTRTLWYISESTMGLGMIGTMLGFLIVLSSAFADIDVGSVEATKEVIAKLSSGMGTALITSLIGLMSSLSIKLQLTMLESQYEE